MGILLVGAGGCASKEEAKEAAVTASIRSAAIAAEASYDYDSAANHFERLYERLPDDRAALLGAARNLRYAGYAKDAIKFLRREIEKNGEDATLLLEIAKALLAASLIADARDTLTKVRSLGPETWEILSMDGIMEDRLGDHAAAQAIFEKALKLSPGNVAVLNNLALSHAQAGEINEGIEILEKVASGENATAQTRLNLALLYTFKGRHEEAERLSRIDLPSDVARQNLATLRRLIN